MNDNLGPEGLVTSSLVFGELPGVKTASGTPQPRDILGGRATMAHAARNEMQRIMEKMHVAIGSRQSVTLTANQTYDPGDQVSVSPEKVVSHRIGEWLRPFVVLGMEASKKLVYIHDVRVGSARLFIVRVKRYIVPVDVAHSFFADLHRGLSHFSSPDDDNDNVHLMELINPKEPRAD